MNVIYDRENLSSSIICKIKLNFAPNNRYIRQSTYAI